MKRASGIGHLKPFLPRLEALLEDPEVSELMVNGPANVWVERGGELRPHAAPALTAAALYRAAADAQKIVDFLLERSREGASEREPALVAATRAAPRPPGIRRHPRCRSRSGVST